MAYKITEDCINCGACEAECPNTAISESSPIYVIDPERCTECKGHYSSSRCYEVCPVDACKPDPNHSETLEQLIARFRRINPGKEPKLFD